MEEVAANHLAKLGQELEGPMSRLIETAAETPRAAAEVFGKLREEVANNIKRDNALLEERSELMEQLGGLAASLEETSGNQQQAATTTALQQPAPLKSAPVAAPTAAPASKPASQAAARPATTAPPPPPEGMPSR